MPGLVDEECDDGNTTSGDGCSKDCKIEYGVLCKQAKPLPLGMVNGAISSSDRSELFNVYCQEGGSREDRYVFKAESDGLLTVSMKEPGGFSLSAARLALARCDGSVLGTIDCDITEPHAVSTPVKSGEAILVIVSVFKPTSSEEKYALQVKFQ